MARPKLGEDIQDVYYNYSMSIDDVYERIHYLYRVSPAAAAITPT